MPESMIGTTANMIYPNTIQTIYWPLPYQTCTTSNSVWIMGGLTYPATSSEYYIPYIPPYPQPVPEAELPAQAQAAVNEAEAAQRAMAVLRDHYAGRQAANEKARQLLARMLSKEQRARYEAVREFEILTSRNGEIRRYLIREGHAGNIYRLDAKGKEIERYCIHTDETIPAADNVVAQKLLLEADEETFLRIANRSVPLLSGEWTPAARAA